MWAGVKASRLRPAAAAARRIVVREAEKRCGSTA
jgi:hypothetical protein